MHNENKRIVIYEYQKLPYEVCKNEKFIEILEKYYSNYFNLKERKAKEYVGIFPLDKEIYIEVLPKVFKNEEEIDEESSRNILFNLLEVTETFDVEILKEIRTKKERFTRLLDFFIYIVAKKLKEELERGVYREYVWNQSPIPKIKGKILFKKDTLYEWSTPVFCRYKIFSKNNPTNQFIRYGIEELMQITQVNINKEILSLCMKYLGEIEKRSTYSFKHHRLVERFEKIISMMLNLIQPRTGVYWSGEKHIFPGFCWDMNSLFQKYVAKVFEGIGKTKEEVSLKIFENEHGECRPDIILETENGKVVIEVKYREPKTLFLRRTI